VGKGPEGSAREIAIGRAEGEERKERMRETADWLSWRIARPR